MTQPQIFYLKEENDINNICANIENTVGLDTEQVNGKVSTIQISTLTKSYVFQILTMPKNLSKLLKSREIVKVGVDIINDVWKIFETFGIKTNMFIDLQPLAHIKGLPKSLDDLCKTFVPDYQSHKNHTSWKIDWNNSLSNSQIDYAAKDAYFPLLILPKIINMSSQGSSPNVKTECSTNIQKHIPCEINLKEIYYHVKRGFPTANKKYKRQSYINVIKAFGKIVKFVPEKDRTHKANQILDKLIKQGCLSSSDDSMIVCRGFSGTKRSSTERVIPYQTTNGSSSKSSINESKSSINESKSSINGNESNSSINGNESNSSINISKSSINESKSSIINYIQMNGKTYKMVMTEMK